MASSGLGVHRARRLATLARGWRRGIRILGAAVLLTWSSACGGSSASDPAANGSPPATSSATPAAIPTSSAHPTVGTISWSDDGCSAAVTGARAGITTFEVVNESDALATFHVWKLGNDATYEEFEEFIDAAVAQIDAGVLEIPPPAYLSGLTSSRDLSPGESDVLSARLDAGTYVVVCLASRAPGESAHIAGAAGPIEIQSGTSRNATNTW